MRYRPWRRNYGRVFASRDQRLARNLATRQAIKKAHTEGAKLPEVCGVCGGTYVRQTRQGLDVIVCDECGNWHLVEEITKALESPTQPGLFS